MTTSSSIISALGAGSGIDMAALAENLATAQFQQRIDRVELRQETLDQQISAASELRNSISLLSSAFGDRIRNGDLAVTPSVSNPAIATATSPSGSQGSGSYSLEVTQLAASQTLTSLAFASANEVVGEGTVRLRFGTVEGGKFTENGTSPLEVSIEPGATLGSVAATINASGNDVLAYVADTATGTQLILKGPEGQENGFVVEVDAPKKSLLENLAWEPRKGDPAQLVSSSADAIFEVDGVAYRRSSNDTGSLLPGLSLSLRGLTDGVPTAITFSDPSAAIKDAMQDFVGALNEIAADLQAATNPLGGQLAGDPGARALKSALSRFAGDVIMPTVAEGLPRRLSDLGVATERNGTFRLDTERLTAALEREPEAVAAMFTNGVYGIYASLDKLARRASVSTDPGSLAGSIARYEALSKDMSERSTTLFKQQDELRATLVARFAKTETRIAASQATLSYLQSQIRAWEGGRD